MLNKICLVVISKFSFFSVVYLNLDLKYNLISAKRLLSFFFS